MSSFALNINQRLTSIDLCKTLSQTYQDWKESPGEGTRRVWSGIIGYSRDKLPFVGPVPGNSGLFAAVAFHGHGENLLPSQELT